jgi:hypothetical protein
MPQIGSTLRAARNTRGVELAQVEAETKISARYLAALEDERFELLPAPTYARGFLRTYAVYLGLEPQPLVDALNDRLPAEEPAIAFAPRPRSWPRPSAGTVLVILGTAGVLAIVLATHFGGRHRTAPAAPATPAQHTPKQAAKPIRPARRKHPVAPAPPSRVKLTLTAARGNCWLSVRLRSQTGALAWEGTLAQGHTLRFTSRRPLWIRIGAPEALAIQLSGRTVHVQRGAPVNVLARPRAVTVLQQA